MTTSTSVKAALNWSGRLVLGRHGQSAKTRSRRPLVFRQDRSGSEATWGAAPFDTTDFKGTYCRMLSTVVKSRIYQNGSDCLFDAYFARTIGIPSPLADPTISLAYIREPRMRSRLPAGISQLPAPKSKNAYIGPVRYKRISKAAELANTGVARHRPRLRKAGAAEVREARRNQALVLPTQSLSGDDSLLKTQTRHAKLFLHFVGNSRQYVISPSLDRCDCLPAPV